ncbi:MAG: hypothetical protein DMF85_06655 [Acidobacteria bacterium]|nr:MAG: hypothetical protein DMF85_06655 [Acidobacteriota bacterium]
MRSRQWPPRASRRGCRRQSAARPAVGRRRPGSACGIWYRKADANITGVRPLQSFAPGVLAEIIRRQPASKERTAFAWTVAVGPALARVTAVELDGTILRVRVSDERWALELERAVGTILPRLRHLLGDDAVKRLSIEESHR